MCMVAMTTLLCCYTHENVLLFLISVVTLVSRGNGYRCLGVSLG